MTTIVGIRDARLHEAGAVRAVDRRAASVASGERHSLRVDLGILGVDRRLLATGRVRVAVSDTGGILGFVAWRAFDDAAAEIEHLAVDRDAVGQGIAAALIDDVAESVRRAGRSKLCVITHPQAYTLFSATGFDLMGDTRAAFGPALALVRDVDCRPTQFAERARDREPALVAAGPSR